MNDLDFFELQPSEKMLKRLDVVFLMLSDKSCEYSCFCLLSSVIACLRAMLIHANLLLCTLPVCLFVCLSACLAARPPFWVGNSEYGELAKKESYNITREYRQAFLQCVLAACFQKNWLLCTLVAASECKICFKFLLEFVQSHETVPDKE
jgi:hypothetical protein